MGAIYLTNYTKTNKKEVDIFVQHMFSQDELINFIGVCGVKEVIGEEAGQEKVVEKYVNEEELNVPKEELNVSKEKVNLHEEGLKLRCPEPLTAYSILL